MLKRGEVLGRSRVAQRAVQTPLYPGIIPATPKSVTAALLDSLIEHPETMMTFCKIPTSIARKPSFPIA